jgi:hypothetical protein
MLALLFAAGCMPKLSKPYPERRHFKLGPPAPSASAKAGPAGTILKVARFTASEPYEKAEFVYRTGESTWETDFYNVFLLPPAVQIAQLAREGLATAGLFGHVPDVGSAADATHVLEGHVRAIYGDFADRKAPKAVLRLELSLLDVRGAAPKILAHRPYEKSVPLALKARSGPQRGPALVAAWSRVLAGFFAEFADELRKAAITGP